MTNINNYGCRPATVSAHFLTGTSTFVRRAPTEWRDPEIIAMECWPDLFHPDTPDKVIDEVFAIMAACPQHTFLIATEYPERMRWYITRIMEGECGAEDVIDAGERLGYIDRLTMIERADWPLPNVWLGIKANNQQQVEDRLPHLLETAAAVRWVLFDSLRDPVDLSNVCVRRESDGSEEYQDCLSLGEWADCPDAEEVLNSVGGGALVDWVVANPNTAAVEHLRSLRDQCSGAGVPFFCGEMDGVRYEAYPEVKA